MQGHPMYTNNAFGIKPGTSNKVLGDLEVTGNLLVDGNTTTLGATSTNTLTVTNMANFNNGITINDPTLTHPATLTINTATNTLTTSYPIGYSLNAANRSRLVLAQVTTAFPPVSAPTLSILDGTMNGFVPPFQWVVPHNGTYLVNYKCTDFTVNSTYLPWAYAVLNIAHAGYGSSIGSANFPLMALTSPTEGYLYGFSTSVCEYFTAGTVLSFYYGINQPLLGTATCSGALLVEIVDIH